MGDDSGAAWRTQVGEGFVGAGSTTAHINTVLGWRGGPVEAAWATALATPRAGHIPFVVVLQPNLAVQPPTLFVNKAPLTGERHELLTWGAAQAGVAWGVTATVADGIIPAADVTALLLIAAVWVSPAADDEAAVYENNREATQAALRAGATGAPDVDAVLAARDAPANPYFRAIS
ncbi:MAG TPA: formaldehyde-activating enzyme [Acidimicrobiia bacterium]|nr:formaldehyde-activating enzyme [Acidimicrobiia bacterium]